MTNREASNAARRITVKLSLDNSHVPTAIADGLWRIVDRQLWRKYFKGFREVFLKNAENGIKRTHGKRPTRVVPTVEGWACGGSYGEFCEQRGLDPYV